jgi:hypothetical protein
MLRKWVHPNAILDICEKIWSLLLCRKRNQNILPFKRTIGETLHAADYPSYADYSVALPSVISFVLLYLHLLYEHTVPTFA